MTGPFDRRKRQDQDEVDLDWSSSRHTLGKGRTQAAPGNHRHDAKEIDGLSGGGESGGNGIYVEKDGDTMTGNLVVPGGLNLGHNVQDTENLYSAAFVPNVGGLVIGSNPSPSTSTIGLYVEDVENGAISIMVENSGTVIDRNNNIMMSPVMLTAGDPTDALHAATKQYADKHLLPTEVVAGANVTVDRTTTPGSVIVSATAGGMDQTTADARYVNVAGDTMTGALTASGLTSPSAAINNPVNTAGNVEFRSNNSLRWTFGKGTGTESGANSGAEFNIAAWSDAGAWLSNPLSINRATGLATVKGDPVTDLGIATKQYVDKYERWAGTLTNVICTNANWFMPTTWASTGARGISHSAGTFTVSKAGIYAINLSGNYSAQITAGVRAFIDIAAGSMYYRVAVGPSDNYASTSAVVALSAGGTFAVLLFQASSSTLNWSGIINAVRVSDL